MVWEHPGDRSVYIACFSSPRDLQNIPGRNVSHAEELSNILLRCFFPV